jgi:hypothetical protein
VFESKRKNNQIDWGRGGKVNCHGRAPDSIGAIVGGGRRSDRVGWVLLRGARAPAIFHGAEEFLGWAFFSWPILLSLMVSFFSTGTTR